MKRHQQRHKARRRRKFDRLDQSQRELFRQLGIPVLRGCPPPGALITASSGWMYLSNSGVVKWP